MLCDLMMTFGTWQGIASKKLMIQHETVGALIEDPTQQSALNITQPVSSWSAKLDTWTLAWNLPCSASKLTVVINM